MTKSNTWKKLVTKFIEKEMNDHGSDKEKQINK